MCTTRLFLIGIKFSSYVLLLQLIFFSSVLLASQTGGKIMSDVAILIQAGHTKAPSRAIVDHRADYSFLQSWDGADVRLWRRTDEKHPWQLFRHDKNLVKGTSHSLLGGKYFTAYVDGFLEIYDPESYGLRARLSVDIDPETKTYLYESPAGWGRNIIVQVYQYDKTGEKISFLYSSQPTGEFIRWYPLGSNVDVVEINQLADALYAIKNRDGKWQLVVMDAEGQSSRVSLPGTNGMIHKVKSLQDNRFVVAYKKNELKSEKLLWRFFSFSKGPQIRELAVKDLKTSLINEVQFLGGGFVRIKTESTKDDSQKSKFSFYGWSEGGFVPVQQLMSGLPNALYELDVLADGRLLVTNEEADANGNGMPGDQFWRVKDSSLQWHSLQKVLPDLQDKEIWSVREWMDGQGLGVQTLPVDGSSTYDWHWYLYSESETVWQRIESVLPLPEGIITAITDKRDGLVELNIQSNNEQIDIDSPVPLNTQRLHWMMRSVEGSWISVRDLVKQKNAGLENNIVAVDARENGLQVDVKRTHDEAPIRLVFYKNKGGEWVALENSFTASTHHTAMNKSPYPQIRYAEIIKKKGLALLHEREDSNWDGIKNNIQLFQNGKAGWRPLMISDVFSGEEANFSFKDELGLLVRAEQKSGKKSFFHQYSRGNWSDIRRLIPDSPDEYVSAYTFASGRGLAAQEMLDSNGNGVFGEWDFYLSDEAGDMQALANNMPGIFTSVQTVLGFGGRLAVSVQESADANQNGIENEWMYRYQYNGQWIDPAAGWSLLPDVISEFHISKDGMLITAQEDWDANGNGQSFELFSALWSEAQGRFIPVTESVFPEVNKLSEIKSIWGGKGLLLKGASGITTDTQTEKELPKDEAALIEGVGWSLYQKEQEGHWLQVDFGRRDLIDIRTSKSGYFVALKADIKDTWELWRRSSLTDDFTQWDIDLTQISDVRFDVADDLFALKTGPQWELWKSGDSGLLKVGYSVTPSWFGFNHRRIGLNQLVFESAQHYLDGRKVVSVPQPEVWFHNKQPEVVQSNAVFAPSLLKRMFSSSESVPSTSEISAVGYGPSGTVIIYQKANKLYVVGFTNGPVSIEKRALGGTSHLSSSEETFLINRFPDGTERMMRFDSPDKWIWSYQHKEGRIYYDNAGYFYNETDSVTNVLSFRVGLQVFSFSQLGSYLFRPDLLEQRLGLPVNSLFELTKRDTNRIQRAKTLAPEKIDIASLKPPIIEVSTPLVKTVEPFIDLKLRSEGIGINESSIAVRLLGAGQAREVVQRPNGDKRNILEFTKRVPLVQGTNQLEITVYDAMGLSHSQRLEVAYSPKVARKPKLFAAVIATSEYTGTDSLSSLPLTQNDVRTISGAFKAQEDKKFEDVVLRTWCQDDDCMSKPTKQNLVQELPRFLSQAENGDYIVIYISGHGLKIESEYFMVPEDGVPSIPATLLSWSQLQSWLRETNLGKKLVFLDTCQSGAVFDRQRDHRRMVQQAAEYDGIYVLSAAAADAAAYEISSVGNGLFTYVVNKGLLGQADTSSDGAVSFEELSFHVARRVRELSSQLSVRMEPYVPIINHEMDFNLAEVLRQQQLFIRISDISSFDNSALPNRENIWKNDVGGLNDQLTIGTAQSAGYHLVVIEDRGNPLRSQLSRLNGEVLGQWRFSNIGREKMLQELMGLLKQNKSKVSDCKATKGAKRAEHCL